MNGGGLVRIESEEVIEGGTESECEGRKVSEGREKTESD